jgi:hypothetical protein
MYYVVIITLIVVFVGIFIFIRKKQAAQAPQGKSPQRGIIR